MSVDNIFIHAGDGPNRDIQLNTRAVDDLFNFMLLNLQKHVPSISDQFEGEFYGGVLAITSVPGEHYLFVYDLIMQACEELDSLRRYKTILQNALQNDPRYQSK